MSHAPASPAPLPLEPIAVPRRHGHSGADALGAELGAIFQRARLAVWDADLPALTIAGFHHGENGAPFALAESQIAHGTPWLDNVYPPDRAAVATFLRRSTTDSAAFIDYRLIVGDGELLWVRQWPLSYTQATARSVLMAIPEQKHLEWECLRVSERECNRLGQELHDDLCQVLTGMNFLMRVTANRARQSDAHVARDIDELATQLSMVAARVRSTAHGLFPAKLNYGTLRDALNALASEIRTRFDIEVALDLPAVMPRQTPEQIIHVYRIVQEAVSNAVRHGHSTAVTIAVRETGSRLSVCMEDNGGGFPQLAARAEGIGIHTMQYRARLLGGTLEWNERAPHGVAVTLTYPPNFSA